MGYNPLLKVVIIRVLPSEMHKSLNRARLSKYEKVAMFLVLLDGLTDVGNIGAIIRYQLTLLVLMDGYRSFWC